MENRDIRIAFFDIDGTLLPPDHHLPESTVAALNILRAKGVQLYLATGRPPYHLHYLKKDLPFNIRKQDFRLNAQCRRFLAIAFPPPRCRRRDCASCCPGWKKQILRFPLWKQIPLT